MQGPLKASFIVAPQQRERICQMRYGDLLAFGVCATLKIPPHTPLLLYPGNEKLRVLYSLPPFFFSKKQRSSRNRSDAREKERLVRGYSPPSASGVLIGCNRRRAKNAGL